MQQHHCLANRMCTQALWPGFQYYGDASISGREVGFEMSQAHHNLLVQLQSQVQQVIALRLANPLRPGLYLGADDRNCLRAQPDGLGHSAAARQLSHSHSPKFRRLADFI